MDFEKLYKEYYKEVYYVCLKYMKNEDDAADMAHDTFVKVYERIDQIKDKTKIKAWMCKIASTTCLDRLRHNNIIQFDSADDNEELIQIEDKAAIIPEKMAIEKDVQEILLKVIGKLSEPQRVCVVMYYYELLTIKEIAERLECPEQTVRSRLNYAKKAMKEEVERLEDKGVAIRCVGILPFLYLVFRAEFTQMDVAVPAVEGVLEGIKTSSGNANSVSTEPEGGISETTPNSGKGEVESVDATTKSDLAAVKNKVKIPLVSKIVVGIATISVVGGVVSFLTNNNNEKSPSTNKEMENVVEDKNNESSGKEVSTKDNKPVEDVETEPEEELLKFKSYTEVEYIGNTVSNLNKGDCREVDAGEYIYYSDSSCENGEETYGLYSYAKDSGKTEIIYSDSKVNFTGLNFRDGMIICALGNKYDDSPRTLAKFDVETKELVEMKNNGKTIMISAITNPVVVNDWIYYIDDKEQLCKIDLLGDDYTLLESEACYYLCPIKDRVVYQLDPDNETLHYITLDGKGRGKLSEERSYIVGSAENKIYYLENDSLRGYYCRMNFDGSQKEEIEKPKFAYDYEILNVTDDFTYYSIMKSNSSDAKLYRIKNVYIPMINNDDTILQELTMEHGNWMKNQLVRKYESSSGSLDYEFDSVLLYNVENASSQDKMVYTRGKETVDVNVVKNNGLITSSDLKDVSAINGLSVIGNYIIMDSYLQYCPIEVIPSENDDETDKDNDLRRKFESKPISVREFYDSNYKLVNHSNNSLVSSVVDGDGKYCIVSYDMRVFDKAFYTELTEGSKISACGIVIPSEDGFWDGCEWFTPNLYGSENQFYEIQVVSKENIETYQHDNMVLRDDCIGCLGSLAYMETFMKNYYMDNGKNSIDKVQPKLRYSGTTNVKLRDESINKDFHADWITGVAYILNDTKDKAAVVNFGGKEFSKNNENKNTIFRLPPGAAFVYTNGVHLVGVEFFFDIVYTEKIDNIWYVTDEQDAILKEAAEKWTSDNQQLLTDTTWLEEICDENQLYSLKEYKGEKFISNSN